MSFYTDFPKYPTAIFNDTDYPTQVDDTDTVYAALVNALKEEMQACFAELGTLPKGSHASVKARLDAGGSKIQDADGDTLIDTEETSDKDEVQGKVAGVEFFRGHADGIITLAKQSAARAYLSGSSQTIPKNVWTKIELNNESYDIQSEFDTTTNHRFTATRAGCYFVSIGVFWGSRPAIDFYVELRKNGGSFYPKTAIKPAAGNNFSQTVSGVVQLAAGDYVELFVYQNSSGNIIISAGQTLTYLTIAKIS